MKSTRILLLSIAFYLFGSLVYSQSCNTSVVPGAAANYLFNNNLNDATTPAYNLNGTGVYSSTAIEGSNSLNLSGTTNVVQNTSGAPFLSTNNYKTRTYSLFIKANGATTANQYIIEEGGTSNSAGLRLASNGNIVVDMVKGGTNNFISFPFPTDNAWHHVAYTYDGPKATLTLYIDGYPVDGSTVPETHTIGNGGLSIGNNNENTFANSGAASGALPFNGLIDDVAVYTSVLTPKQLKDIAACANLNYIEDLDPMNCPDTAFLVQTDEGDWYDIDLPTGEDTEGTDNLISPVNAIGYNVKDQRIWGYDRTGTSSGKLVVTSQLDNGTYQSRKVGPITSLPIRAYNTGDVIDGKLYLSGNALSFIAVVDVDPNSSTYLQYLETINLDVTTGVHDFAINPIDGKAYGIFANGTSRFNGNLIQIDLDPATAQSDRRKVLGPTGVQSFSVESADNSAYGATYFDGDGFLYASNNVSGKIFRLDLSTDPGTDYDESKTIEYADGPSSMDNDGAFCTTNIIPLDLGDAPDTYKTLISSNGARHIIGDGFQQPVNFSINSSSSNAPALMLGSIIDRETVAAPNVDATGDDDNQVVGDAGNDEDAISDPIIIAGAKSYTINVDVTNTSGANAYLSAWIDFTTDGDFGDAGEQIANDQVVPNGATSVQITNTAPELTSGSDSYARFRICDATGECNTFSGLTNSGEVEDYTVTLIQGTLLPVELISFTAESQNEDVVLEWATATELNNDKFELEYSLDGITFEKFGEVAGQGTTKETTEYAYKHNNIGSTGIEQVLYRLRQVDFDGTASFSEIRVVVFASVNKLVAYPVPAEKGEQVIITGTEDLGSFKVYNMKGSIEYVGGSTTKSKSVSIATDNLSSGIYFVVFNDGKKIRFIVK